MNVDPLAVWDYEPPTLRPKREPLPQAKWPVWAKMLRQFSTPNDKGIGDVVARIIGDENSESFKAWFQATFNKPCGCNGRQAQWNRIYPLNG